MDEGQEQASLTPSAKAVICQAGVTESATCEWRIMAETVPGATHLRSGTPNQDALLQVRESSISLPLILSLSDGHGSPKCFRSHLGARFAVNIGTQLLREALNQMLAVGEVAQLERHVSETLPVRFARSWEEAVTADLARAPFTQEEFDCLEAKDGARARQLVQARPMLAYGATTLTVAVSSSVIIYLQLGDGAIVTISDTGEVRRPLPTDERLLANETTSLCSPSAAQDFRCVCHSLTELTPALILVTTDGYANSFADETGFLQVGHDLLEMLRAEGFDAVNRNIKGWLAEATRLGSGDDCTLGIIVRMDALRSVALPATVEHPDSSAPSLPPNSPAPEHKETEPPQSV